MAPRAKAATADTPVSHRFKTSGEGRIKSYSCSCGQWNMTGSEKRVKSIREQFDKHATTGGLSSVQETPPPAGSTSDTVSTSTTGEPLDLGDSGSAPNE